MGFGFPGQQSVGILAGAVALDAELDAAKVTNSPLPSLLGAPNPAPGPMGGGG